MPPPLRAGRVWAVAVRDWRMELGGRRIGLPLITGLLLLPIAGLRGPAASSEPPQAIVQAPLPPALEGDERLSVAAQGTRIDASERPWRVRGPIAPQLREALDEVAPEGRVEVVDLRHLPALPARSLWLALLSGSVLTGALSSSVPGERSNGTLSTLLTSSLSRLEVVTGKWLAWTLFGGLSAWAAAAVAVGLGRQAAGWWLLPLPWVAGGTVALGLYLVRDAADVISGATIPLRVLPAMALVTAGLAWALGSVHPVLGAAVPLGGALLTAGGVWTGAAAAWVATASTAATSAALLARTASHLGRPLPPATAAGVPWWGGPAVAVAWWLPTLGPRAWTLGGNPDFTAALPATAGWLAGGLGLAWVTLVGAVREPGGLARLAARPRQPAWALVAAPLLAALVLLDPQSATTLSAAGVVAVLAQELALRGWLAHSTWLAVGLGGWLLHPSAPWVGWAEATLLLLLARRTGSWLPGAAARVALLAVG